MKAWFNFMAGMVLLAPLAVAAVMSNDAYPPPPAARDQDYVAGLEAFRDGDWQGVIQALQPLVERRPWDDEAHNLIGYAYRRLGNYRHSLEHYAVALELNPYNRGALEYLGEAYLELDRPAEALGMLSRLESVCRRLDTRAGDWRKNCQEWGELKAAIDAYRQGERVGGGG